MSERASAQNAVEVADWRLRTFELYAEVRTRYEQDPQAAHSFWIAERNRLFAEHPASALSAAAKSSFTGLNIASYDPAYRFQASPTAERRGETYRVQTGTDGVVEFECLGTLDLPTLGSLALWRHQGYGGGIFLPFRDSGAGKAGGSYGGGRYLLDSIKGSLLGYTEEEEPRLVIDFNFAYNPSCAYDESWACPLPGPANRLSVEVPVGELTAL
ncbi:hypothetical protein FHU41_000924 [Psychromicrobium silvestre]|uniref:DUF1684 domain-containing protein n=1 Tax=Psychromicrobium silvestre TaxID=1645614 RepID=A0A7Y9LSC8_9MICC|nr:DUF1684 domain-containing protein [Psychromicrobium silvestre]NYE94703.1 hypothetical protein [Psychromicrobium silvestre]